MRRLFFRRRRPAGRMAIVVLLLASVGCNRGTTFFHDATFASDPSYMEAASLMPGCACVTLKNVTASHGTNRPILLVSTFLDTRRGSLRLDPGQLAHVRFDWGGPDDFDRYRIYAYNIKTDGTAEDNPLPRAFEGFDKDRPIVETTCGDSLCEFGPLSMDRAHSAVNAQHEVRHEPGVHLIDGGQQIELAAAKSFCGCVVVENIAGQDVSLRATFHSTDAGALSLPGGPKDSRYAFIGFDSAGSQEEDVYTLSAVGTKGAEAADSKAAMPSTSSTKALKISDNVRVLEEMNFLHCAATGAEMPRAQTVGGPPVDSAPPPICPFAPFTMNRAKNNAVLSSDTKKNP